MAFLKTYNFSQTVSSTTWTIPHAFNVTTVAVDTFIDNAGDLEKILPLSVEHTDNDTLTINFTVAQTGIARVLG